MAKILIIPNDPEGYAGKITYVDDFSINNNATVSGITSGVDDPRKIICSILPELQEEYQKIQLQQVKLIHLSFSSIIVRERIMIQK